MPSNEQAPLHTGRLNGAERHAPRTTHIDTAGSDAVGMGSYRELVGDEKAKLLRWKLQIPCGAETKA